MAHHPNPTPRQNAKIECRPGRGDLGTPPRLAQHFGDAKGCPYADVDAGGVAPEVKRVHGRWIVRLDVVARGDGVGPAAEEETGNITPHGTPGEQM